jgi:hypothetical protein
MILLYGSDRWSIRRRKWQGFDRQDVLASHMQRRSTRNQELKRGAGCEQPRGEISDARQDMLTVVEQQKRLPGAQMTSQFLGDGLLRRGGDGKRRSDRARNKCRFAQRSQVNPREAVGKVIGHIVRDGDSQGGFTDPTWPGKCDERDRSIEE